MWFLYWTNQYIPCNPYAARHLVNIFAQRRSFLLDGSQQYTAPSQDCSSPFNNFFSQGPLCFPFTNDIMLVYHVDDTVCSRPVEQEVVTSLEICAIVFKIFLKKMWEMPVQSSIQVSNGLGHIKIPAMREIIDIHTVPWVSDIAQDLLGEKLKIREVVECIQFLMFFFFFSVAQSEHRCPVCTTIKSPAETCFNQKAAKC